MSIENRYAIVGVGYTPQGRLPNRTSLSFHIEACRNALDDAGLTKKDLDGLIVYRQFLPSANEQQVTPYLLSQYLGISPGYMSQEGNCSRSHLQHAIGVLEAGFCKYVLVSYGSNALSGNSFSRTITEHENPNESVFGNLGPVAGYALAAQRAMHEFHTGPETWKHIAVGQRKWAQLNPKAALAGQPLSFDDYNESRWVVEPFRISDCSMPTDGGRAIIITSLDRARDLKHTPAVIMGLGQHNPSGDIQSPNFGKSIGAGKAGSKAFKMAGIQLTDVDACEIYDCFTYTVEATLQDYGFFGPGEGEDWFSGGRVEPGGKMPVNTSGGQLAEAYFMGLTPLSEATMQIMGRCGSRQIGPGTGNKPPEIILCSDNGGIFQCHSCLLLRKG